MGQRSDGEESEATNDDDYDLELSPSVDTASGEFNGFEFDAFGRVNPGDILYVDPTAPVYDGTYNIEIYDTDENVKTLKKIESNETLEIDTGEMPVTDERIQPGLFVVIIIHEDNQEPDDIEAAQPLVAQGYEVTVDAADYITSNELDVTVSLSPIPEDADEIANPEKEHIEVLYWTDKMQETVSTPYVDDQLTYDLTLTDLPNEDFQLQGSFMINSDHDDLEYEPAGVSDPHDVAVPLVFDTSTAAAGPPQDSSPDCDDERVFVAGLGTGQDTDVLARERDDLTAEPAWSHTRAGALSDSSPAYDPSTDRVFVGSGGGVLYALDADDGTVAWTHPGDGDGTSAITGGPVVENSTVVAGATDGTVTRVDADSGNEQWAVSLDAAVYAPPAVDEEFVYVTTATGDLVTINSDDETVAWTESIPGASGLAGPAVADGTVYAVGDALHAIAGSDDVFAPLALDTGPGTTPVVDDGWVYCASAGGRVFGLAPDEDEEWTWTASVGDEIAARPTVVDGRVLVAAADGRLRLLDGESGDSLGGTDLAAELSLAAPVRSSPVIDDENIYLGVETADGEGRLAAVSIDRLD